MHSLRKPSVTADGVVHLEARHFPALLCDGMLCPGYVYAPADTCVTCVSCIATALRMDALHGRPKAVQSFRDALP